MNVNSRLDQFRNFEICDGLIHNVSHEKFAPIMNIGYIEHTHDCLQRQIQDQLFKTKILNSTFQV